MMGAPFDPRVAEFDRKRRRRAIFVDTICTVAALGFALWIVETLFPGR